MGDSSEGRLGNVAGVVVGDGAGAASAKPAADLLARICEQVTVVDDPGASPLARLAAGLEAVDARRVLVIDASRELPSVELVLALTAWPESPVVLSEIDSPACGICVRESALGEARERLDSGETAIFGKAASAIDPATRALLGRASDGVSEAGG